MLHIAALITGIIASGGPSVTPIASVTGDLVSYILGYGVLGIVAIAFAFRLIVPKGAQDAAVAAARVDLIAENKRLIEEKHKAEEQRDEALKIAEEKLVPLLTNFVSVTSVLIPLLQQAVASQERTAHRRSGGDSR